MRFQWRVGLSGLLLTPWLLFLWCAEWAPLPHVTLTWNDVRVGRSLEAQHEANRTLAAISKAQEADSRPLLVRFAHYVDGTSPVYYGYGGESAMTIFSQYGFMETTTNEWDLLWTMVPQWENMAGPGSEHYKPKTWQVHNHCLALKRNEGMAGTKESQWKHIMHMQMRYGSKEFDIMPETLILPDDDQGIKEKLHKSPDPWIMKPVIGKQGIGVSIVTNKKQLPNFHRTEAAGKRFVLQKYIASPYLVLGRKFHMRLYLVLTSLSPLRVLIHSQGLVLFAVRNYSDDAGTYDDMKVHLTNSAVADRSQAQPPPGSANGWLLTQLWQVLILQIGKANVDALMRRIDDAFVKLALAAQLEEGGFEQRRSGGCFDLFGVDVLVDKQLKVHVMEVNVGPEVVSPHPDTHKANDLAHKAVLADLVPLAAMSTTSDHVKKSFHYRLSTFMTVQKLELCPPNAFVLETAKCLTTQDVEDLWRLYRETEMLGSFRRLYPAPRTAKSYTQYFHAGLDSRNYWAILWVETFDSS